MTQTPESSFQQERQERISRFASDQTIQNLSNEWVFQSMKREYLYNFDWLGRPIIQFPQDIVAIQELVWRIRPSLIVETGIAHGGSLALSAALLALLDYADSVVEGKFLDTSKSQREVIGIDIDIRKHNRRLLDEHPLRHFMQLIEGSSTSTKVLNQVTESAKHHDKILVILDSNHTHEHVLTELRAYAPLVSVGSYCVVLDTFIENMPEKVVPDRPWGIGNNPMSAVREFLAGDTRFQADSAIDHRLLISAAPSGYLQRIR